MSSIVTKEDQLAFRESYYHNKRKCTMNTGKAHRRKFDKTIGRLDRILSLMVGWSRGVAESNAAAEASVRARIDGSKTAGAPEPIDEHDQQTLKHHAEDMIAAGEKILRDLGGEVEASPQPTAVIKLDTSGNTGVDTHGRRWVISP